MLSKVIDQNGNVRAISDTDLKATLEAGWTIENKNGWRDLSSAQAACDEANTFNATNKFFTEDRGSNVSPRYSVLTYPEIGDEVSYAFNGDSHPDGVITKISKTKKVIETSTGNRFYRRHDASGRWVLQGTWTLIQGHISKQNPEF